uniref:Uncharacterized protein n=1 Tax=Solanum tuberosum TaxID=4113 RepID=M1DEP1_SOLTU
MDANEQKGTKWLKEGRKNGLTIAKSIRRVAERPTTSPNVPVCLALKKKVKFARKGSSWGIIEQFRKASPYHPMIQNVKMLKEKAKSGGDPSVLINIFRVKTFGYDPPGATLRVPEEDPNLGQASCQSSLKLCLEGGCPRRGLAPPGPKVWSADSTVSNLISRKLVGRHPRQELVSRQNL